MKWRFIFAQETGNLASEFRKNNNKPLSALEIIKLVKNLPNIDSKLINTDWYLITNIMADDVNGTFSFILQYKDYINDKYEFVNSFITPTKIVINGFRTNSVNTTYPISDELSFNSNSLINLYPTEVSEMQLLEEMQSHIPTLFTNLPSNYLDMNYYPKILYIDNNDKLGTVTTWFSLTYAKVGGYDILNPFGVLPKVKLVINGLKKNLNFPEIDIVTLNNNPPWDKIDYRSHIINLIRNFAIKPNFANEQLIKINKLLDDKNLIIDYTQNQNIQLLENTLNITILALSFIDPIWLTGKK